MTIFKDNRKKSPPKIVRIFTNNEVETLVAYFEQKNDLELALLLKFAVETGWRIGEILTLTWGNVTDDAIYRTSKDKRTTQGFPLTANLAAILAQVPKANDKVFRWQDSSRSSLLLRLNAAMEAEGIEKQGRGWHTFRKTARKRWMDMGLPIEFVKRLMGHSDIRITEKHYTVVYTKELRDALDNTTSKGGAQ